MFKSSNELHELMSDAFVLYNEMTNGTIKWGKKMNKDGSADEWISNKSARHLFESLYELAWDLRKLNDSKMASNQRHSRNWLSTIQTSKEPSTSSKMIPKSTHGKNSVEPLNTP
jgi:hypothetical protein